MATQPRGDSEPAADRHGTDGRVELLADLDRPGSWMLLVDGISQSHVDLGDPRHLDLEYMQRLGHLIDLAAAAGTPLRVLHLGAGGLTLARYVAATRPGSRQLAVEADAEVARLVRQRLPLGRAQPGTGRIGVRLGDARATLEKLAAGSFDVVVADVFAGDRTPAHLTSVEFTTAAAGVLAPTGVYAVNVGDGPPLAHARGRVAAVRAVFPHVCVMAEPAVLRGRRFGNLVVVGSHRELPLAGLTRRLAADPFPARLVAGAELDQFIAGAAPITDALAGPSPPMPPEVFA
jgi:spermidine synthase